MIARTTVHAGDGGAQAPANGGGPAAPDAADEPVYHLRGYGDVTREQLDRYVATGSPYPAADAPAPLRGSHIKATWAHCAGAFAQCHYCKRYSDDLRTLGDRPPACDCGDRHGWSGSFLPPTGESQWSSAAPPPAPIEQVSIARVEKTPAGPVLLVCGVEVTSWLGCAHDERAEALAERVNASASKGSQHAA